MSGAESVTLCLQNQMEAVGLRLPDDSTMSSMLLSVGRPFVPTELPPAQQIVDLSPASQDYVQQKIQPGLKRLIQGRDEAAWAIGESVGRLFGEGIERGFVNLNPPFNATKQDGRLHILVDTLETDVDLENNFAVDLGIGIHGILAYRGALRDGSLTVYGIAKNQAEASVLDGLAAHQSIDPEQLVVLDGGMAKETTELIKDGFSGEIDFTVASRVHMAGKDLGVAIRNSGQLAHQGSALLLRGPRDFSAGMGYATAIVHANRAGFTKSQLSATYDRQSPTGYMEPNLLTVLRKQ